MGELGIYLRMGEERTEPGMGSIRTVTMMTMTITTIHNDDDGDDDEDG